VRIETIQSADPDTVYAPGAFDQILGKEVPLIGPTARIGTAKVISAEVAEDGKTAVITIETDDHDRAAIAIRDDPGMGLEYRGFGFKVTGWGPDSPGRPA
jgi:hypothetical protein